MSRLSAACGAGEQRAVVSSLCRTAPQQGHRHRGNRAQFSPYHCSSRTSRRQSSCAIVPLCNRGETCARETCHAHVCPATEPRSLLPGDEWAMLTALPGPHSHREPHQTHPTGNAGVTEAQGSQPGCRDSPQRRGILGKSCWFSCLSHSSTSILEERRPSFTTSHFSPGPHEAAVILTCHLNEKRGKGGGAGRGGRCAHSVFTSC